MQSILKFLTRGDLTELSRRYSDIVLAAGVVMIIGMMIIPLPTPVLDLLLVTNITISVTMLMMPPTAESCSLMINVVLSWLHPSTTMASISS